MIYLEKDNLREILTNNLTLVDFYAPWCAACKQMDEILKKIDDKFTIIKVDIDKFKLLTYENRIMSIPTIIIYKNKEKVSELVGVYREEELEEMLSEYA